MQKSTPYLIQVTHYFKVGSTYFLPVKIAAPNSSFTEFIFVLDNGMFQIFIVLAYGLLKLWLIIAIRLALKCNWVIYNEAPPFRLHIHSCHNPKTIMAVVGKAPLDLFGTIQVILMATATRLLTANTKNI